MPPSNAKRSPLCIWVKGSRKLTSIAVSAAVTRPTNAVSGHVITKAVLRAHADLLTTVAIVTSFTR